MKRLLLLIALSILGPPTYATGSLDEVAKEEEEFKAAPKEPVEFKPAPKEPGEFKPAPKEPGEFKPKDS